MRKVDGNGADDQAKRRHYFKKDERLDGDAAYAAQLTVAGDSGDEAAEDERRNDQPNQTEKDVAEEAGLRREARSVDAEFSANQHGEERPNQEGAAPEDKWNQERDADPAQRGSQRRAEMHRKCGNADREADEARNRDGEKPRSRGRRAGDWHVRRLGLSMLRRIAIHRVALDDKVYLIVWRGGPCWRQIDWRRTGWSATAGVSLCLSSSPRPGRRARNSIRRLTRNSTPNPTQNLRRSLHCLTRPSSLTSPQSSNPLLFPISCRPCRRTPPHLRSTTRSTNRSSVRSRSR